MRTRDQRRPTPARTVLQCVDGPFTLHYFGRPRGQHCVALQSCVPRSKDFVPTVRIHSACLFSEAFRSQECECREQLDAALSEIALRGGAIIYMMQEGRGIGLFGKTRAMELQRVRGVTTAEAYHLLGHKPDPRNYNLAIQAMTALRLRKRIRFVSNNPRKMHAVERAGFQIVERVEPLLVLPRSTVAIALAKQRALGHIEFTRITIKD